MWWALLPFLASVVSILGASVLVVVSAFASPITYNERCSALLWLPVDSTLPRRRRQYSQFNNRFSNVGMAGSKKASPLEQGAVSETNANEEQATEIFSNDSGIEQELAAMPTHTHNPTPHHVALRVRDIELSIKFCSLLGFAVETKFRAGPAKAAWLKQQQQNDTNGESEMRIELIEIPKHMLQEPEGKRFRAPDGFQSESLLGFNHFALDVTHMVRDMNTTAVVGTNDAGEEPQPSCGCDTFGLSNYMEVLNQASLDEFNKSLRVAMDPKQVIVGQDVYEMGFIYEPDGALIELLCFQTRLESKIEYDGWEPWKETSFNIL